MMDFKRLAVCAVMLLVAACGGNADGVVVAPPGVVLAVTGPETPVLSGATVTYVVTVDNEGPDTVIEMPLAMDAGATQTLGAVECQATGGAVCPDSPGSSMVAPRLPANGRLTFRVTATVGETAMVPASAALTVTSGVHPPPFGSVTTTPFEVVGPNRVSLSGSAHETYTQRNAELVVTANGNRLDVVVNGDVGWFGTFVLPDTSSRIVKGSYANVQKVPFHDPVAGGMTWWSFQQQCNTLTGSFTVSKVTYDGDALKAIDLQFEQRCGGSDAVLSGDIHWTAYDTTVPPGPVHPPPAGLWQPAPGTTPASGNYIFLESEGGDPIGGGRSWVETPDTTSMSVTGTHDLEVKIAGGSGVFSAPHGLGGLRPGYYGDLKRYGFHNFAKGAMNWDVEARRCAESSGWFVIDSIASVGLDLVAVDMRFEQRCVGASGALRGKIHWVSPAPQPRSVGHVRFNDPSSGDPLDENLSAWLTSSIDGYDEVYLSTRTIPFAEGGKDRWAMTIRVPTARVPGTLDVSSADVRMFSNYWNDCCLNRDDPFGSSELHDGVYAAVGGHVAIRSRSEGEFDLQMQEEAPARSGNFSGPVFRLKGCWRVGGEQRPATCTPPQ